MPTNPPETATSGVRRGAATPQKIQAKTAVLTKAKSTALKIKKKATALRTKIIIKGEGGEAVIKATVRKIPTPGVPTTVSNQNSLRIKVAS